MTDPFDRHNLFGQCVGPFHSKGTGSGNSHGTVDTNLSLNSASNLTPEYQAMPTLGQLGLHQHVAAGRFRRVNLTVPCSIPAHSTCDPYPMRPRNTLNINVAMGNNCSININLLNSKPPSQLVRNNSCASSSSIKLVRSNAISPAPLNLKQPFSTPASIQEPMPETGETSEGSQLTTCLRQGMVSSFPRQGHPCDPYQNIDFQRHSISRSKSNLSFLNPPPGFIPNEKHYHLPLLQSSTMNPEKKKEIIFYGENDTVHEDILHAQPKLQTLFESSSATPHARDQVSDPNTKITCLLEAHLQALSQAPLKNETMTRPQRNLAQTISTNHSIDQNPQARSRQHSVARLKSHPYLKYGPYTCPQCHVIFESGYCFAAHVKKHYKGESPAEQKKRREGKIRNRDLHITHSTAGITVIPWSLQPEDKLQVTSNTSDEKATKGNQREVFSSEKIKEEIIAD